MDATTVSRFPHEVRHIIVSHDVVVIVTERRVGRREGEGGALCRRPIPADATVSGSRSADAVSVLVVVDSLVSGCV